MSLAWRPPALAARPHPIGSISVEPCLNPLGPQLMTHPPRDQRCCICAVRARVVSIAIAACAALFANGLAAAHEISQQRLTPVVVAVRNARAAVVSIRGQKTVTEPAESGSSSETSEAPRQVNGM